MKKLIALLNILEDANIGLCAVRKSRIRHCMRVDVVEIRCSECIFNNEINTETVKEIITNHEQIHKNN